MAHFVGIDWGSQSHQVCVIDANRSVLIEAAFAHSGTGLSEMVAAITRADNGCRVGRQRLEREPLQLRQIAARQAVPQQGASLLEQVDIPSAVNWTRFARRRAAAFAVQRSLTSDPSITAQACSCDLRRRAFHMGGAPPRHRSRRRLALCPSPLEPVLRWSRPLSDAAGRPSL